MHILQQVLLWLLYLVQGLLAFYLVTPLFMLTVYWVRRMVLGKNYRHPLPVLHNRDFSFGLIITAHQDTRFIDPLVDSILKQTHPHFKAYVVADDCDISNLHFTDERVQVLRPTPALHAKIKSIQYALDHFDPSLDAVIILDVDSLLHPNFLAELNRFFQAGYLAVQANFKAKNTDTSFAKMDAIGDIFNFFLERKMRMDIGFSAAIWGSGVAVHIPLYKEVEYKHFLGGFDKKLQAHLVQRVPQIGFAEHAIIYDEKITDGKALEKQRTRWIHAQFKYMKYGWEVLMTGLKRLNANLIYFALMLLRPPLFMVVGAGLLLTAIGAFVSWTMFFVWASIMLVFFVGIAGIVATHTSNSAMRRHVWMLPAFAFRQLLSLLKIKRASKSFLKTEHTNVVYIEEVLAAEKQQAL